MKDAKKRTKPSDRMCGALIGFGLGVVGSVAHIVAFPMPLDAAISQTLGVALITTTVGLIMPNFPWC